MREKRTVYNYSSDSSYEYISIHRKANVYDPRNTTNLIVKDYFNTIYNNKDTSVVYYKMIERELDNYDYSDIPISYKMIYHDINIAWVDIIHQMVFIENVVNTFCSEYKEVLENIVLNGSVNMKESVVYRYFHTGESVFHTAAKLWIFNNFMKEKTLSYPEKMLKVYDNIKFVLSKYLELENILFNGKKKFCITFMTNFKNIRLVDSLQNFAEELKKLT